MSLFTDQDIYLFQEGTHQRVFQSLGAHVFDDGVNFAVWAPSASAVSVIGDFNGWNQHINPLCRIDGSGIWEGFVHGVGVNAEYKYCIESQHNNFVGYKADPFGFRQAQPPRNTSLVWKLDYEWRDGEWMERRRAVNSLDAPISIYEVHLGSWRRVPEVDNRPLTYRELAAALVPYVKEMGFTHVEFMPITEHPFYGSWGYQTTGYFSPTSRYGTPQELMYLIDEFHSNGIGVILDWVPSHFPQDEHGLGLFDGQAEYEDPDPLRGIQPEWNSFVFHFGRPEVRSFLLSNAFFWLERFHIDALRVDAVASMLYLDYARPPGGWRPNKFGGRENIEAIGFLRGLNERVFSAHTDVQTIAEESTAWPMVSRPTYQGGLGFGMKWDMGWMHDTLAYLAQDPAFRKYHHHELTFRMDYAFNENFVLPLSHDEVVYGKGSLLNKMPGDQWRKFANLRLLFGYMWAQPGKKLLFMGCEFGQWREWNHDASLDWHLLDEPAHRGVRRLVTELNRLYKEDPSLNRKELQPDCFEWVERNDAAGDTLAFLRRDSQGEPLLAVFNFSPYPRPNYFVGAPLEGTWRQVLNTDNSEYGGSAYPTSELVETNPIRYQGQPVLLTITLPPLAALYFKRAPNNS